jgi:hypothetical protein
VALIAVAAREQLDLAERAIVGQRRQAVGAGARREQRHRRRMRDRLGGDRRHHRRPPPARAAEQRQRRTVGVGRAGDGALGQRAPGLGRHPLIGVVY